MAQQTTVSAWTSMTPRSRVEQGQRIDKQCFGIEKLDYATEKNGIYSHGLRRERFVQ